MREYTLKDLDEEKITKVKPNPFGEYIPTNFWEDYGKVYRNYFKNSKDDKLDSSVILNLRDLIARINALQVKSVLEVGCGFGRILPSIVEALNLDAYGIELSSTMIEDSKKYLVGYEYKDRIHIQQAPAQKIPFGDKSFDLIYTHVCLTHIPPKDIPTVVDEITRVASKYVIHIERFWYPYEHSHPHHWSHLLAPLYIERGWEMLENTEIHERHHTKIITMKRGEVS